MPAVEAALHAMATSWRVERLLAAQNGNDPNVAAMRNVLRKEHNAFVKMHGFITSPANGVIKGKPAIGCDLEGLNCSKMGQPTTIGSR